MDMHMYRSCKASPAPLAALLLALLLAVTIVGTAAAHGATIAYSTTLGVEIVALYDSGEPMAQAQVAVYAPDDPATVWLAGTTDDEGRFSFSPDPALPGTWDVQVRQGGHGHIVHIPIEEGTLSSGSSGFTPLQIVLMSASVIWGFAGTALYFSRRNS
jgi:nickel transport protein